MRSRVLLSGVTFMGQEDGHDEQKAHITIMPWNMHLLSIMS